MVDFKKSEFVVHILVDDVATNCSSIVHCSQIALFRVMMNTFILQIYLLVKLIIEPYLLAAVPFNS